MEYKYQIVFESPENSLRESWVVAKNKDKAITAFKKEVGDQVHPNSFLYITEYKQYDGSMLHKWQCNNMRNGWVVRTWAHWEQ